MTEQVVWQGQLECGLACCRTGVQQLVVRRLLFITQLVARFPVAAVTASTQGAVEVAG